MKNKQQKKEIVLKGKAMAPGIAVGPAFIFKPFALNLAELNPTTDKIDSELEHFEAARKNVLDQLMFSYNQSAELYGNQFSDIFESQIAFLEDPVLVAEIKNKIIQNFNTSAYAVSSVLSKKSEHFINLENTYFRERAFDIIDLKQKLLMALFGIKIDYQLTAPSIIVAENLSPSDTVNFNRNLILGFLTDHGGETSHSTILARGLAIPSVVNGVNLSKIIQNGEELIVDGFSGTVIINPKPANRNRYLKLQDKYQEQDDILFNENTGQSVTSDGKEIQLLANIELAHEVNDVLNFQASGIGLYRTEALFLESSGVPSEKEQFNTYKKIAKSLKDKPFVLRTIDLGGDKLLEGYTAENEQNPFLGWRAIRFCLDNPEIIEMQLRAILQAACFGDIRILIPMINSVDEIKQIKQLLQKAKTDLQADGKKKVDQIHLGIMIETPAAAIMAPVLTRYVDFISIGSNDLTQYILAVDRTNSKVAKSYSSFDPSVLKMMQCAIDAANANSIPVSICGEFASVPHAVPLLIGMGLCSMSVTPHIIPMVSKIIRSVNSSSCVKLYGKIKELQTASEVEKACLKYLNKNVPELSFSKEDI